MLDLLFDRRTMNVVIMTLYGLNIIWWLFHGSKVDATYWVGALIITATVTWGFAR